MDYSQIFYIDPPDNVESVKKKLKESRKEKIILVLPEENKNLKNIRNLTILKKEAQVLNKKLTIFSTDHQYRRMAEDCGIEIEEALIGGGFFRGDEISFRPKIRDILPRKEVKKEDFLQNKSGHAKDRSIFKTTPSKTGEGGEINIPQKRKFLPVLLFILFITLIAGGAVISLTWLPKATIVIVPVSEEIDFSGDFSAKQDAALDIKAGVVQGTWLQKEKEVEKSFLATGEEKVVEKAKGKITIYNETSSSRGFVAGTRFESADGKEFKSQIYVSIPAGSQDNPGAVEIEVIASEAGDEYNIGPTTFNIPGLKPYGSVYEKVYAKSTEEMKGGFVGEAKVVLKEDIDKAKEEMAKLEENLVSQASDEILKEISSNFQFLENEISIEKMEIVFDKNAGDIGETFKGSAKVKARVLVPREEDVQEIIADIVKNEVKDGIDFEEVVSTQKIEYKVFKNDVQKGELKISFEGNEKIAWRVDGSEIRKKILGMSEEELQKYIKEEMKGKIKDAEITLWPFWINKVPTREDKVFIEIKYE